MRLRKLRNILFIAPHPDDEIIGCGGLLVRSRATRSRVRVVIMTDGTASHRSSTTYPSKRLARIRRTESRHALKRVGVTAAETVFVSFEDGAADRWKVDSNAMTRFRHALTGNWDCIAGPCDYDAHPDHRQTAKIVRQARRDLPYLSYPIWSDGRRSGGPHYRLHLGHVRDQKRSILKVYRSQLGLISDDPNGFSLTDLDRKQFDRPSEMFRLS